MTGPLPPGLLVILAESEGPRVAAAIEAAATAAALGRPVALLLKCDPATVPALATLHELGADCGICQSAMAAMGLAADQLPSGVYPTGMVGFLAGREQWQLLLA